MVTIRADEISKIIRERIEQYNTEVKIVNTGTVLQVGDGIARIYGLEEVMAGELVEFEEGTIGIALNLESKNVGVVLMGDGLLIQEGSSVKATGRIAQIPVSEAYLSRVINALAKPIDGRGEISASESRLIESPAPGIISRRSVYEPLQTGLIAIDSMIPIGRGQRELIIGDRQTGKTAVATDTILLSPAIADPISVPTQDMLIGLYILTNGNRRAYQQKRITFDSPLWLRWRLDLRILSSEKFLSKFTMNL
ncbi:hypothetical protein V8G54_023972 [Vigna mungo]|uniref:ATP synthase CF1 alpha subunit n=1 Tax=Vigna mungo TaxID=3915 RepID=A0AAQ3RT19_VIGMU